MAIGPARLFLSQLRQDVLAVEQIDEVLELHWAHAAEQAEKAAHVEQVTHAVTHAGQHQTPAGYRIRPARLLRLGDGFTDDALPARLGELVDDPDPPAEEAAPSLGSAPGQEGRLQDEIAVVQNRPIEKRLKPIWPTPSASAGDIFE